MSCVCVRCGLSWCHETCAGMEFCPQIWWELEDWDLYCSSCRSIEWNKNSKVLKRVCLCVRLYCLLCFSLRTGILLKC